jgi:hypothetical protein
VTLEKILGAEKLESFRTPTVVIACLLPVAMLIIRFVLVPNANAQYREKILGTSSTSLAIGIVMDCALGFWIWKNRNGNQRKIAIALYWMVLGSLLGVLLLGFQRILLR